MHHKEWGNSSARFNLALRMPMIYSEGKIAGCGMYANKGS